MPDISPIVDPSVPLFVTMPCYSEDSKIIRGLNMSRDNVIFELFDTIMNIKSARQSCGKKSHFICRCKGVN